MSTPPFITTHRVEFFETDLAGIVHFANYYRFMEQAEHAFFRALGLKIHDKRLASRDCQLLV
jgi:acyl-CoA thioester hydrolase